MVEFKQGDLLMDSEGDVLEVIAYKNYEVEARWLTIFGKPMPHTHELGNDKFPTSVYTVADIRSNMTPITKEIADIVIRRV